MEIEVGKQYKTRGGWRAVVVDTTMEGFLCWHNNPSTTKFHHKDGSATIIDGGYDLIEEYQKIIDGGYDLIEEYQEPEVIEGWVEIYGANIEEIDAAFYDNRANLKNGVRNTEEFSSGKTFAVKRIKFTVGERDDLDETH
jgi:hypothetical protein